MSAGDVSGRGVSGRVSVSESVCVSGRVCQWASVSERVSVGESVCVSGRVSVGECQ